MRSVLYPKTTIESLEVRRLMSGENAPTPGMDIQFLSDVENDTTPTVSETTDPVRQVPMQGGFHWFDGTSTRDLIRNGGNLQYIHVDGWNVWPRDNNGVIKTGDPSEVNTRALADWAVTMTDTVVVDIENWQMDIRSGNFAAVNQNIARFQNIISWIRSQQPSLKVGIYSIFPISDLYNTVQYEIYSQAAIDPVTGAWHRLVLPATSNAYAKLQNADAYLYTLAQSVDYVFPALYTSSPDQALWDSYARNTIAHARRYGKPVIPFLMPTYHHASGLNQAVIPDTLWQHQLDTMTDLADGAVIWTDPLAPTGASEYWIQMAVNKINGTGGRPSLVSTTITTTTPVSDSTLLSLLEDDNADRFSDELIEDLI